ncbi:MAG: hypothetical protein M1133_04530 [Armatimonadetes bacterium]|nr:hypothetical protein [Armatimonadota bacterium]
MAEEKRKLLWVVVVLMIAGMGVVQHFADPSQIKMNKQAKNVNAAAGGQGNELMVELPGQMFLASFTGFKEVIAGALWVRADTFFHTGQFQAIIPIVRLVTWLDPHNIDVYTTGAWHLDYNFVDDNQMSDKRYIPASVALLQEGIANNPKMWDLYFELGWTHYNKKLQDQAKALEYIEKACRYPGFDPNTGGTTPRPEYVDRMLAHQYEKVGRFEDAIEQWEKARKRLTDLVKEYRKKHRGVDTSAIDICDRNLGMLYLRYAWRYGNMDYYKKGVEIYNRLAQQKSAPIELVEAARGATADYARRTATNTPPGDALKTLDTGFQVEFKKIKPRVFRISGKLNLAQASEYKDLASEAFTHWYQKNQMADAKRREYWRDGCRVNWMLTDYDYKPTELKTFSWKIDTSKMVVWDSIYVGGGQFSKDVDLSISREFYPFKAKKYKLTVWVNPQQPGCPDFVQDRVGWKGEAFTDKNYLDTKTLPGFKLLKWERVLERKELI